MTVSQEFPTVGEPGKMPAPELLPCPFCGSSDGGISGKTYPFVRCEKCGVETECVTTEKEAAETWNRRTSPPDTIPISREDAELFQHLAFLVRANAPIQQIRSALSGRGDVARRLAALLKVQP